jgi:hypothetical protein
MRGEHGMLSDISTLLIELTPGTSFREVKVLCNHEVVNVCVMITDLDIIKYGGQTSRDLCIVFIKEQRGAFKNSDGPVVTAAVADGLGPET